MKRYIALLRGINISGKNKVAMAELRRGFEELGYTAVKTCLNSGNVMFSSEEDDVGKLTDQIREMLENQLQLDVPVFVMPQEDLEDILCHAPNWWGSESGDIYDNLIFIMPPASFEDVYGEIGAPKEELERIQPYRRAVFWSFNRKDYQKTNWWPKTASADIRTQLTIRTANTVRKIVAL